MASEDTVTKADLDGFRSFLLTKLDEHKTLLTNQYTGAHEAAENALSISKQLKSEADIKFSHPGNERNFKFNRSVEDILQKAVSSLESDNIENTRDFITQALTLLRERNRKIRIADSSEAGWLTVKHYEASAVALDPEDDKKIRQAEREALRAKYKLQKSKRRPDGFYGRNDPRSQPHLFSTTPNYRQSAYAQSIVHRPSLGQQRGACRFCGAQGHWWRECPVRLARILPVNYHVGTSTSTTSSLPTSSR